MIFLKTINLKKALIDNNNFTEISAIKETNC